MVSVHEPLEEGKLHPYIIIIDGCHSITNALFPILSAHFEINRISIQDSEHYFINATVPDAVLMTIGESSYNMATAWLKAIRTREEWYSVPIMSYIDTFDELAFLQAGATDCWVYPTSPEIVVMRLNHHIQRMNQLYQHQRKHQKYQKAYLDQSRLVEIATHDLQHPINDLMIIELLLRQYTEQSPQLEPLLGDMNRAIIAMQETLGDVLTALNLRGRMQFNFEYLPVAKILLDIGLKYTMRASNKQIDVFVGQTEGMIYADPKRVMQIVENLVSNAVKYSPPKKEIHIWSEVARDGTYIRVRDWGAGVPPAERDLLFSEFGKLSSQPTGNENSIGLGLWVVKQLTYAMNGEVGASFPDEGGSIFWVLLPNQLPV